MGELSKRTRLHLIGFLSSAFVFGMNGGCKGRDLESKALANGNSSTNGLRNADHWWCRAPLFSGTDGGSISQTFGFRDDGSLDGNGVQSRRMQSFYPFGVVVDVGADSIAVNAVSVDNPALPKTTGPSFNFSSTNALTGKMKNGAYTHDFNCLYYDQHGNEVGDQPGSGNNVCFSKFSSDQVLNDKIPDAFGSSRHYTVNLNVLLLNGDELAKNRDGIATARISWLNNLSTKAQLITESLDCIFLNPSAGLGAP